jgi:MFS family permease
MSLFSGRLAALRHTGYRRYWLGSFASVGAVQLQTMGQGWLVFQLTGSALMLGYLGAAASIPAIVMTLFGGAMADRLDKRYVLMTTSGVTAALLVILTLLDYTGAVTAWHVIIIAAVISFTSGFDWPTRQSIFPTLIEREDMMSAVALNSIIWQSCRMIMPAFGGILIAYTDTWLVFLLGAAGFLAMLLVIATLELNLPKPVINGSTLNQIAEGVSFIFNNQVFFVLMSLSYAGMFFANTHMQLMPAFAELLDAGETGYGYLMSATGVGSVVGTILVGSFQHSRHLGIIIFSAAATSGLCILGFCFVTANIDVIPFAYALAMAAVFAASLFSSIFMICQMTVLQLKVPDHLRGRVMGIHGITYSLMPLGGLLAGAIASMTSTPVAVAIGVVGYLIIILVMAASQADIRRIEGTTASAEP